ncbi:hypothetical protein M1583_02970, partial [Candidatus Marsarchaeota archaeon]|nr:hypothetical protein [Candidatus Marsarchaeota archaeon]
MKSVISELENHGFCLPDFKKSNLSLMQDLASPKSKLNRNGKRKAILLIDGLGYDTLARAASKDKKLSEFIERNSLFNYIGIC